MNITVYKSAGMTLNSDMCEIFKSQLKFSRHIIDETEVRADPAKTVAVIQMSPSKNVTEVRRFIGMVNQLSTFIPNCATILHPLNVLLSKK